MSYFCKICNYKTDRKYRYERHLGTQKHEQKVSIYEATQKANANLGQSKMYKCKKCGKEYSHRPSLTRHRKKCGGNDDLQDSVAGQVNALKEQMNEMMRQFEERENKFEEKEQKLVEELKKLKKNNGVPQITNYNFIQQNFGNAPVLKTLDLDAEEFALFEDENEFMDTLEHHYNNGIMDRYLGDYVIRKYKTENPAEQAMWNTDKARNNYLIRDMIDENGPYWCEDASAREIKNRVIRPLLKKIDQLIRKRMKALDSDNQCGKGYLQKALSRMQKLSAMQTEAKYDNMAQKIIRYITPVFHLDQGVLLIE